jgi:predicted transcriptional regulator
MKSIRRIIMSGSEADSSSLELVSKIVSAYVTKNRLSASELPELIRIVYEALNRPSQAEIAQAEPAVPIKASVRPDHIICLEDGKKLKMLKRHLRTAFDISPDEYRQKWGLPSDYPMVAPNYAAVRSALAKKIGLGRNAGAKKGAK